MMSKQELITFEEEIKDLFLAGRIHSPVHLSGGNEDQLIEIFKDVKKEDTICSTHRSHYHALLKGVSPEWLRNEILQNRSMHINNAEKKFLSSAIVGGILPIATGIAMAIKRQNGKNKVWCFVGDMTAETGIFHECTKYAKRNNLPITFVIEDNGVSTDAPTQKVWGMENEWHYVESSNVIRYRYTRIFPHVGCGKWVSF